MKSNEKILPLFSNSMHIEHHLFLYTSTNFSQDLTTRFLTLERFVSDMVNLKALWIKPLKNSNYYELLLPDMIVLCSFSENRIELSSMYDKNLRNHAQFMKEGLVIGINKEIVILHQNVIQNKNFDRSIRHQEMNMGSTISDILAMFTFLTDRNYHVSSEVNHKHFEAEFENWLNLYDESAMQHLESNITAQPQIRFDSVKYEEKMFGPFSLSFVIDSILPIPLTKGHYIFIKSNTNEWVSGTILERYVDDNKNVLVLKFERLYQASEFNQSGHLFLFMTKPNIENKMFEIYYNQLSSDNVLKRVFKKQLIDRQKTNEKSKKQYKHKFNLDADQARIMEQVLDADSIFYINGSTTTGKTTLLNALKAHYEAEQKRVLYVSADELGSPITKDDKVISLTQKLISLKRKTLDTISQFEDEIISDKKNITILANDALDLRLIEEKHALLTRTLEGFYQEVNKKHYSDFKLLFKEFEENEIRLNALFEKIEQTEKKIVELETRSQFGKFMMIPVLVSQQKAITRSYERYNQLLNRQFEVKGHYNIHAEKIQHVLSGKQLNENKQLWTEQRDQINLIKSSFTKKVDLKTLHNNGKDNQLPYTEDVILSITNKLESLHQSIREFKQMLLNQDDETFFSIFIKQKTSLHVSMKLLHDHFLLFANEFDVVLIDDAQSSTALELLLAISLGKKVIVAGDIDQHAVVSEGKSYLDDIYNTEPQVFQTSAAYSLSLLLPSYAKANLQYLYRIIPALTTLYNTAIFTEDSFNRNRTESKKIVSLKNISNPLLVLTTSQTKNRHESEIIGYGIYNHIEATTIVNMVSAILSKSEHERFSRIQAGSDYIDQRIKAEDILITSFFDMQIEYIRSHLRYALPQLSKESIDNMVRPIISCTGIERKLVFLSLCASSNAHDTNRDLQTLKNSSFWNIALSRTKHQLIIIGDVDYIKNSTSNEHQRNNMVIPIYKWTNYDVANVMKSLLKLAMQGEIQFLSLETFAKQLQQVNGGFGYEH